MSAGSSTRLGVVGLGVLSASSASACSALVLGLSACVGSLGCSTGSSAVSLHSASATGSCRSPPKSGVTISARRSSSRLTGTSRSSVGRRAAVATGSGSAFHRRGRVSLLHARQLGRLEARGQLAWCRVEHADRGGRDLLGRAGRQAGAATRQSGDGRDGLLDALEVGVVLLVGLHLDDRSDRLLELLRGVQDGDVLHRGVGDQDRGRQQ